MKQSNIQDKISEWNKRKVMLRNVKYLRERGK